MSHVTVQLQTISTINTKLVPAKDLPSEYISMGTKWANVDRELLLLSNFSDYWVLDKTTTAIAGATTAITGGASYNLFCGSDVSWSSDNWCVPAKLPTIIIIIENAEFKGILVGDVIKELIDMGQYGIFMWLTRTSPNAKIPEKTTNIHILGPRPDARILVHTAGVPAPRTLMEFMHQGQVASAPSAFIQAGGSVFAVPAGYTVQEVRNTIPNQNQFAPLMNISHYRRC